MAVVAQVHRGPGHPGIEALGVAQLAYSHPRAKVRVVDDVLGVIGSDEGADAEKAWTKLGELPIEGREVGGGGGRVSQFEPQE